MTAWIIVVLLLVAVGGLRVRMVRAIRQATEKSDTLHQEKEELQARDRRLFEFLHVLGEATLTLKSEQDITMHRLIADGTAKVLKAQGGVLYLLDSAGKALVPRGMSKDCPPLVALPERVIEQERTHAGKLASFLKLHSFPKDFGILGDVFMSQKALFTADLTKLPQFKGAENPHQEQVAALIAPLTYGKRQLGVLAVASMKPAQPFEEDALTVIKMLAEECALALGNRQVHQEIAEKDRLDAELRNAREIQRILLPEEAPATTGFVITGRNIPARYVSGDYYDFFRVDDSHIGVAIADVSGKGIPAALITAMCRSVLRAHARDNLSPSAVLSLVNRDLFPDIMEDMFISMLYAVLRCDGASMTISRAGHPEPYVWRARNNEVEVVDSPGIVVGFDKGEVFDRITKDVVVPMEPGDCLLLYTDGVNEATDPKGLLFGEERIQELLAKTAPNGAAPVVESIVKDVESWVGSDNAQQDDITLIAIKRKAAA